MIYTVWHERVGGRDGSMSYISERDATIRFEELAGASDVVEVEMTTEDYLDDPNPKTVRRWSASAA